ncbi:uncharacterized protein N7529_007874 [Penicillium soppii]|uniref:uncharacterized protein n=1 Tax=Penicillium soppii TaxID=69789 RepID=UPI0025487E77|nr:uncharacterized protein N7529_007874 [Penicillium soppii]KAJ5860564.1 hypothetical protein N7529_007874 [Penicillium soppii]
MSNDRQKSQKPQPPQPRNHLHFDPWQSGSTGHQRAAQGGTFIGSTSWRTARSDKLTNQYKSGDCLPGREQGTREEQTLVPGAFDGKCGPDSPPKASGEWVMLSEDEAMRNKLGVRDIRSFMGVGKRKASDGFDNVKTEKRIKSAGVDGRIQNPALDVPKTDKREETQASARPLSERGSSQDKPHTESNTSLDLRSKSNIFAGITIFINGSTLPQISEYKLKHLLASNGAKTSIYMARKTVTHVLVGQPNTGTSGAGGGLSASKLQQEIARGGWKGVKIVSVDWAVESIKAGKRLAESLFPGLHVAAKGQRSVAGMFGAQVKK